MKNKKTKTVAKQRVRALILHMSKLSVIRMALDR